jgi:small multidrug resistance pump
MFGAWALLLSAIVVEVGATTALPRTHSFRDPLWTVVVLLGYAVSIWLLALVIRHIPVSVTYAVWAGLGTAGIAVVSALLLGESLDFVKAAAIALIIVGVVVLNLHGAH